MTPHRTTLDQLEWEWRHGRWSDLLSSDGVPPVFVVGDRSTSVEQVPVRWPGIVVECGSDDGPAAPWTDLRVDESDIDHVVARVSQCPRAAMALIALLRGSGERSMDEALLVESATYSMLQAGPEFERWLSQQPPRRQDDTTDAVLVVRRDGELSISLNRPARHNALDRRMRDGLIDAVGLALADDSIDRVVLDGAGPSYSAGGDLLEFGTFSDSSSAHVLRLATAIGPLLQSLGKRLTVRLHGVCYGSGIELPAFASTVIAAPDATFALPELGLGLIPGAGGTWSIPRRIGRHRTAWLVITGRPIDAVTALQWGLIDGIEPKPA